MTQLPASIEQYLQETGFSATEILVLKRLLEGTAMTLRELASKTGKSTGVLDQATKKLIDKGILTKESINDTQKYAIASLEAIQHWVEEDMIERHTALKRKKENFDAFLATVQHQKNRPEIEFFEGVDGIKTAFNKLINLKAEEWLHFAPAVNREEDDPLAQYRVELFRERRKRKIFMRAITPDVPLGHRYQSRDVYEYRQTKFVPPEDFPVTFEQYIVGDTVACIDVVEHKASFIHFPQLADGQRNVFSTMWNTAGEVIGVENAIVAEKEQIPLFTNMVSALRDYFLGAKAIALLFSCFILAIVVTHMLYIHNVSLNTERVRERVKAIAATAAPQFDYRDIDAVQDMSDVGKEEYKKMVRGLIEIKDQNPNIEYSYIMRATADPYYFEFVADADSLSLIGQSDLNEDGLVNDVVSPGQLWLESNPDTSAIHLAKNAKLPAADPEPIFDEWGVWISGHAPIFDPNGNVVAILGVDMFAESVNELNDKTFNYFATLSTFFVIFILLGYFSFLRGFKTN